MTSEGTDLCGGDACSFVDSEPAELFECKIVKARKSYRCEECGCEISPGDKYEYVRGLWEGYWDTFRTCLPCSRIRSTLMPCAPYGGLKEYLHETFDLPFDSIF